MRESFFNTEVVKSLNDAGAWAYKISDVLGSRFTADKPFDIFGCYNGIAFAIESKQIKEWKAFGSRYLRDSQVEHLQKVEDAGGRSYVFLNVRIKANKAEKIKQQNLLLIFKFSDLKSGVVFKKDKMKMMPYIVGHKKRFDLTSFLYGLTKEVQCQKT